MNEFIILAWLERVTGIEASSWVLFAGMLVAVCNLITKKIPADSTGWQAKVRAVTAFLGLVMSSRVTSQATTMDVVKTMADHGVGQGNKPVVRSPDGKFAAPRSEEGFGLPGFILVIFIVSLFILLSGCAMQPKALCERAVQVKVVADSAVAQCYSKGIL